VREPGSGALLGRASRANQCPDFRGCLPLVPARAAAIVDGAFVAEALKRSAIVWDVRDAAAYRA
jgi:hypothetical protein